MGLKRATPRWTTYEANFGSTPRSDGTFTITGSFPASGIVIIVQAVGPYTSKAGGADEAVMDQISAHGTITNTTTLTIYWSCRQLVRGNYKFHYQVQA